jgi:nucleoside 2-deoxyribosyltransferase
MSAVYLAGPINGCSYREMHDWRDDMTRRLNGHTVLDPSRRLHLDPADVVEADKTEIDASDILIAYCPKPTVGTSMEVLYAWERGKHVILYLPEGARVSPWLRYHAHHIHHHPIDVAAATITLGQPGPHVCGGCGYEIAAVGAQWCHTDLRSYAEGRHEPKPLQATR